MTYFIFQMRSSASLVALLAVFGLLAGRTEVQHIFRFWDFERKKSILIMAFWKLLI